MDEYLSEQEQWERVKLWLRQNGLWIVAGVAIAAAGLGGYKWWQARVEAQLLRASEGYQQLIELFARNDLAAAEKKTDELLATHAGSGYADYAQLALARLLLENGDRAKALQRLESVMNSSRDRELRLLARLRVARVQIDQQQADAALATLAATEAGALAPGYAEVRGDALYAKGDKAGALKAYQEAVAADVGALDTELLKLKIADLTRS